MPNEGKIMDEIQELAEKLEAAIKEQRAIRGRAVVGRDDSFDIKVRAICEHLLDASDIPFNGGCGLCGC
jgi:hypothetical protein